MCRFLQSCSNVRRMSCFWWQLTHNITFHIIGLSLKKSCFEINMQKRSDPLLAAISQLFRNQGLVETWESVCMYSFYLSWKPLNTNLAFALRKMPCLSVLMVSTPSSCHIISRIELPHVDEIKNLVVNHGSGLQMFCFSKLFVVSSYFLS